MLRITIPKQELWDEVKQEFFNTREQSLQLEHSLVSLSKWESKWEKPFLVKNDNKSPEEIIDYVKCMTLTQNVNPKVYRFLTQENLNQITHYINAPMTATTVYELKSPGSGEQVTAELIYYWMISLNIPFECQKWHLNRLLTLIKVCNFKNSPAKKMTPDEIRRRNATLNAARRKKLNSKG